MEERIAKMKEILDEAQWRQYLAVEAKSAGYGGITKVSRISGASRTTITRGIKEIGIGTRKDGKVRKSGGGRKYVEEKNPAIEDKIRSIVEDSTYGDPMRVLTYTTMSLRKISKKLLEEGIQISHETVGGILENIGYSRQSNQKMLQKGESHPDRNAQFEHINKTASEYIQAGDPVISVDTKKKELIGNFKNSGTEYRRGKDPRKVLDHDFPIEELGKISPYGVYIVNNNIGFVNVGTSHDTSEFAVESIARWWETVGKHTFTTSRRLYINCDCGGSNSSRGRMWKYQLQQFADRTGLTIEVSHFPPGTSKWNKIEHRLFCYISKNWQGKPLVDVQTAVKLIGSTTTTTGLTVTCVRDDTEYRLAKTVSDDDFNAISILFSHGLANWNYQIFPH